MRQYSARLWASLLTFSLLLSLAACGGADTAAASMHLRRTEGTVAVSDGGGKDVPLLDDLGLYSGYEVRTRSASYAWIDLDAVKLTKLDQNSEIAIEKEGKALDIRVRSGSLFFNVTEPLEDDETMNIRTSTMLVGIRGTCGWVEDGDGLFRVYLLEGRVRCSAEGQTVRVSAGEMAELTENGELVVEPFTVQDIPGFVLDDLIRDSDLCDDIYEASGLNVSGTAAKVNWNGHTYRAYDISMTWEEAKAYCEDSGGHLVTITSAEEQQIIEELLDTGSKKQYWIGLSSTSGTMNWVTDEELSYTNWDRREPDGSRRNTGDIEQYVQIYNAANPAVSGSSRFKWNDMYYDNTFPGQEAFFSLENVGFICEWDTIR